MATESIPSGFTGEKHPEIFKPLSGPKCHKPGQLSQEQVDEYYRKGFTVVKDFFTKEEVTKVQDVIMQLVDDLANRLYKAGKISKTYSEYGYRERLTQIENEFPGATIILHKTGKLPEAFRAIAAHERLLNIMEQFIGPDIAFSPVWNLRTKTPKNNSAVVPWHQDTAYFDNDVYKFLMMTAWIPFVHATAENGTMEMVPGCHTNATVAMHTCCWNGTWYVMMEDEEMEKRFGCDMKRDVETLEVPLGSFILFNNFTPHRSLPNVSQEIRWALDFRWQAADKPGGLFGLKQPCVLRLKDQPDFKPDWDAFDNVDRNAKQLQSMGKKPDEFSTLISGPWMKKWHITESNRHTESFVDDESTWDPNMVHG